MTYPLISIIIVNFNQKQLTVDCLNSLSKITYPSVEMILIDNGSQDGSSENIKEMFPKVHIIKNGENLGFTGGNNIGIQASKGKYILLLNNDTKVTPNFLETLVEDLEKDSELGIVQSKIFVMDKKNILDSVISFQTATGFLFHQGYLENDAPEYQKFLYTFSAKGACMMVRKEIFNKGLLDKDYFAYFEETDLCWRAWVMGYKVGFEPRSIIYHKMGATSSKMKSAFIHYHSFKNRIRTIIKNAGTLTLIWMLFLHLATCLLLAGYFLIVGQTAGSTAILKGIAWNIIHLQSTLVARKQVQGDRMVSDRQIFQLVFKNPSLSFYFRHLSLVKQNLQYDRKT